MPKENPSMTVKEISEQLIKLANQTAGGEIDASKPESFKKIERIPLDKLIEALEEADPEKILTSKCLNEDLNDFTKNKNRLYQLDGTKITLCVLPCSLMGTQMLKPEDFDDEQSPIATYLNLLYSNKQDAEHNEKNPAQRPEEKTGLCSASGAPFYLPLLKVLPPEAIDAGSFIVELPKNYPNSTKPIDPLDPHAQEIYYDYLEKKLHVVRKSLRKLLFDYEEK